MRELHRWNFEAIGEHTVGVCRDDHEKALSCNYKRMKATEVIELIESLRERAPQWISVEDKLPDIDDYVIWYYESGAMAIWEIDKDMNLEWLKKRSRGDRITHWMPLPQPPKEAGE
jgi:hypothetical protein